MKRPPSIDLHRAATYLRAVQAGQSLASVKESPDTRNRYTTLLQSWGWITYRNGRTFTLTDQGVNALEHIEALHTLIPNE